MKVKSQFAYTKLVTLLAGQIGQLINLHEISSTIRLNHRTLDNYLYLLENTYVLVRLRPYFTNLRKELTKMPKVYFIDTGLRNFALKNFAAFEDNRDKGSLLENFCFSSLVKIWKGSIYFWRTKEKTEVDFLVKDMYGNIIPIEVKAQRLAKPVISRGFQSFLKKYKVKKGYIVNLDLKSKVKLNDTIIEFILPYEVPFLIK
jgi:predicted AAA+ superfamily ATPase